MAKVTAYTTSDFFYHNSVSPLSLIKGLFVIQSFWKDILVLARHQCNDARQFLFLVLMGGYGVSTCIVLHQRLMFLYTNIAGLDIHKKSSRQKIVCWICVNHWPSETDYKKVKNLVTKHDTLNELNTFGIRRRYKCTFYQEQRKKCLNPWFGSVAFAGFCLSI